MTPWIQTLLSTQDVSFSGLNLMRSECYRCNLRGARWSGRFVFLISLMPWEESKLTRFYHFQDLTLILIYLQYFWCLSLFYIFNEQAFVVFKVILENFKSFEYSFAVIKGSFFGLIFLCLDNFILQFFRPLLLIQSHNEMQHPTNSSQTQIAHINSLPCQ